MQIIGSDLYVGIHMQKTYIIAESRSDYGSKLYVGIKNILSIWKKAKFIIVE